MPSRAAKRTASEALDIDEPSPAPAAKKFPRNKRYAKISVSGNLDTIYLEEFKNKPQEAYNYICLCSLPFPDREPYDPKKDKTIVWRSGETPPPEAFADFYDAEDDEDDACDGGDTCICTKPATAHPNHKWIMTAAARLKYFQTRINCDIRNPELFDMYTFNDHAGYGVIEVIENLLLDYEAAKEDWQEQWVICETLAYFLLGSGASSMFGVDDSEKVASLCLLLGRLFIHTLSHLQRLDLLSSTSEITNLGTIMALWNSISSMIQDEVCLPLGLGMEEEQLGLKREKKVFTPSLFNENISRYAEEYGIELNGLKNMEPWNGEDGDLPSESANKGAKSDPWKFWKGLREYKKDYAVGATMLSTVKKIGGDALDLTSWSPMEREEKSYDGKDPLKGDALENIKSGGFIQLA
ncbi:hypothetical protein TWF694_005505 [Orbilia ellipsospora]|uniref:Uncharacterized protein n=1 Tax=Orbilia ellipsospora TaxID=2528407 RepID=A0AAV9WTG3_9PEZI